MRGQWNVGGERVWICEKYRREGEGGKMRARRMMKEGRKDKLVH